MSSRLCNLTYADVHFRPEANERKNLPLLLSSLDLPDMEDNLGV